MINFASSLRALNRVGVLGMNRRNVDYISRYNSRDLFPLVDNKLLTKKLALENDLQVPGLIGVIEEQSDVRSLDAMLEGRQGFCLKPAKGSGGKGILVILDTQIRDGEKFFKKTNGDWIQLENLKRHATNILAGLHSLGGAIDTVLVEELIRLDPLFNDYSYEGIPDVRVIVFRGVPVMAMMRLSTASSNGKANLHQGAVGVGIDMSSGKAINAVQKDHSVSKHPDTKKDLTELKIPQWHDLLALACQCADLTGLGYLGVDLVIDEELGPSLLELNARPGLSIQIANYAGLLPRLRKIEEIARIDRKPVLERVKFAQEHFGAQSFIPAA